MSFNEINCNNDLEKFEYLHFFGICIWFGVHLVSTNESDAVVWRVEMLIPVKKRKSTELFIDDRAKLYKQKGSWKSKG